MDYCAIGSVADLISDNLEKPLKLNLNEEQIESILQNVVGGVVYLHANGIYHR